MAESASWDFSSLTEKYFFKDHKRKAAKLLMMAIAYSSPGYPLKKKKLT
jgi:hypothetical protein